MGYVFAEFINFELFGTLNDFQNLFLKTSVYRIIEASATPTLIIKITSYIRKLTAENFKNFVRLR